jgi:hypothetical protein
MNTSPGHSTLFATPSRSLRGSDAVQARVAAAHPLTHSEELQSFSASNPDARPHNQMLGSRSLHPGDILYWVACLGGACLLLICATR